MSHVRCKDCMGFVKDQIGDGTGVGTCKAYQQYKKAGESQTTLKTRLIELGNQPDSTIFWGGLLADRECNRYKAKA